MRNLALLLVSMFTVNAQASDPAQPFKKVLLIVLENTDYTVALKQPYLKSLIKQGAVFKNFVAETHPSQPNYIAMIAGSPMGVRDDGSYRLAGEHLGNLLEKRGLSWKAYAENYPGGCFQGDFQGLYARKHVGFLSFENVLNNPTACAKIVDEKQFQSDIDKNALPSFSTYTPNLNNDGHDTTPVYADRWLEKAFGSRFSDPKFMKDLLVVITFDESLRYTGVNQILTLFLGEHVAAGSEVEKRTSHYDVLRTIEDQFQIGNLGRGDATAKAITGIWK